MSEHVDAGSVVARVAALAAGTRFVGIDGFGAAGKTTLAERVAATVPRAVVVHVDDFSGPGVAEWDWARFGAQVRDPLRAGRAARYQVRNWTADRGGLWREVPVGALVLVEGVSATRADAAVDWDLTVWVDAPRDVRLARALDRDGPRLMSRWLQDWMPSEQAYAERERPRERVDLIVDGTALDAAPRTSGTMEQP